MPNGSKREFAGYGCYECGRRAQVAHHIIPHSLGGRRTIPLCNRCHKKIHGHGAEQHSLLTKKGMARAKAAGKTFGPKPVDVDLDEVEKMYTSGSTWSEISAHFKIPATTITHRIFKKYGRYGFATRANASSRWAKR